MKLNKQSLMYALVCATNKTAGLMFAEAQNSLQNGTLEIDGYEKSEWIKFDPNNPKTFPPIRQHIIACNHGHMNILYRYPNEVETDEQFANRFSVRYGFTHWHPTPKPPIESDK